MTEENAQVATEDAAPAQDAAPVATTEAAPGADPAPAPTVDAAVSDDTPTPEEARALFAARPDAAGCVTTEGWMRRDGTFPS